MPTRPLLNVMPAPGTNEVIVIRSYVREAELAARKLLMRAAYLEKRAGRPRADAAERDGLNARARELRSDADALLAEISELSRRVTAA